MCFGSESQGDRTFGARGASPGRGGVLIAFPLHCRYQAPWPSGHPPLASASVPRAHGGCPKPPGARREASTGPTPPTALCLRQGSPVTRSSGDTTGPDPPRKNELAEIPADSSFSFYSSFFFLLLHSPSSFPGQASGPTWPLGSYSFVHSFIPSLKNTSEPLLNLEAVE